MKEDSNKKIGVFIIPSVLTAANLFCGFYSIVAVFKSDYVTAAIAILIAMLFDGFDGKVARLTNSTSRFGVEFDSLSDLVSFGVAPGLLIYTWALNGYGKIGWLAVFLFIVCGAMRLARFNVRSSGSSDNRYFLGLPIPAAAGLIVTTVIFDHHILEMGKELRPIVVLIMTYLLAYLMVSTIRYRSFKDVHLGEKKPLSALVAAVLILIVIVAEPQIMLFVLCVLYASSGPVERFLVPAIRIVRRKAHEPGAHKGR
ncbi:MAG: CDP-diacylglycerol--serine O-phosphatidyltransferase [Nitrospirota bacterium]|mgnify:CR=1 FL=1